MSCAIHKRLTGQAPWYHYIPLKPDYSDFYDIMAFFAGPIDELGNINEALGHDVSALDPMNCMECY